MCLAVLFGKEELTDEAEGSEGGDSGGGGGGGGGGGSTTVPAEVSIQLVAMLADMLNGTNPGSPVSAFDIMALLSTSDANTDNLVHGGLLDVIALTLSQGEDVLQDRTPWYRYNVPETREAAIAVLLNLALSPQSAGAVADHHPVREGTVLLAFGEMCVVWSHCLVQTS
jgi:hypothetical protein